MISTATTLLERIEHAAKSDLGITFIDGDDAEKVSYPDLYEAAKSSAGFLQSLDIGPGSRVAILGPTTKSLVIAMQSVWISGATLVMLPLPMRLGSIDEFVAQTRRRIAGSDVDLVVGDEQLTVFIEPEPSDPPMVGLTEVMAGLPGKYVRPEPDPDAVAILQFTSGSTADPKGVVLPNKAITANLDAVILVTGLTPGDDVMVSWLPLYHDMGLVGFLVLPMTSGVDLVLGAPQDFLAKPVRWMQWLSTYGGTATAGPNFSWVLATRALKRSEPLDLSRLRVGLNGAEPVDPTAVQNFIDAGAAHGMRPGAVYPAFGMAEVVIGATMPPPMRGLVLDHVDRASLESERFAQPGDPSAQTTRTLVKLGPAIDGFEMRIIDTDSGEVMPDRFVGELQFRGPSVCSGYYNRPDATASMFVDGWLCTGDLGYIAEGDLVLC
ncbi:MAG: AMP-binding protein, partial [Acidimicrobiales bacterium]